MDARWNINFAELRRLREMRLLLAFNPEERNLIVDEDPKYEREKEKDEV